ncbi:hypothetical protein [Shewanella nanhaiensis]|uniref:hypothetical protein n=1 Tax=Shewanella nanhaiensis TaxID=2864872 RepID=UPI001E2F9F2F|nr:hypothetical protein [Shewanella nanhaiensis]
MTDIDSATNYLKSHQVKVLGEVKIVEEGPTSGLQWIYFLSPWGMQLELVSYNQGLGYEDGTMMSQWSPYQH